MDIPKFISFRKNTRKNNIYAMSSQKNKKSYNLIQRIVGVDFIPLKHRENI